MQDNRGSSTDQDQDISKEVLNDGAFEFGIDSLISDRNFYFSASNNPPPPLVDLEGLNELFIVGGAGDVNLDAIDPWESGNLFQ